jgi:tetratricopeptide (TPR) repeat protein
MRKSILYLVSVGILAVGSIARAMDIKAELIMKGDKSWQGSIVGRDGDWIEFKTSASPRPIRLGASTIKEIKFEVAVDPEKLNELMQARQFEKIIAALNKALEPFSEFGDIPSNLTRYNFLKMELYYRTKQYDKSLEISAKLSADDRDPVLQEKSRVYQALTLIDAGRSAEAEVLLDQYGWSKDMSEDTSPEKLYITAKLMVLKKDYSKAMELVATVIAFNSQNLEWMQPAEMLCAEVYAELGMYDSADEVCREIMMLYKNTPESDMAQQLKIKIEKLRAEQKLEVNLKSEEA